MVNVFFQGTIGINGFSMVLSALNHHQLMFNGQPTIDFNGFLMDFRFFRTMVNDGLATPKLQKVCKFNSWQNMFSQHRRENHCSNNNLTNNFSFLYRILTISIILAHLKILKRPLKIFNGFGGHHYHWIFFGPLTIANDGFQWFLGRPTIGFNGFRWSRTIGQTMEWFQWIEQV